MSGVGQSDDRVEASTSGMMETSMMEGEEYYNPDDTGTWTQKATSDQLCRICAKPNQYLIPIFEGEGIEHQLEPKIHKHLPIEVSESDDLPLQVCYQCASTLIAWNDLVIACIEADKKLRQMHEQEDEDDKGVEIFDEPILHSDDGEESVQPSSSIDTIAPEMQIDTTSHPKRSPGKAKKPKLKMTLVKSPTAGPSGLKSSLKRTATKTQESAVQEATERTGQPHSLSREHINHEELNKVLIPVSNDSLKKRVYTETDVVKIQLEHSPEHDDSIIKTIKYRSCTATSQNKGLKVATSHPTGIIEGTSCSLSTTFTSDSTAKTSQHKSFGQENSCTARLTEESVSSITNTCKADSIDKTNQDKATSAVVEPRNKLFKLRKTVNSQQVGDDHTNLDHKAGGSYAIRCLKSSTTESAVDSVKYLSFASGNHPSSRGTMLKPEKIKSYPKSTTKVVKVSHIKWHALKDASGSVYSCACCGQKNIAIDSVINHVKKKCVSLSQFGEHEIYEPHTLTLDVPSTEIDASKVTLDPNFDFNSISIDLMQRKAKEQPSVPVTFKGGVVKSSGSIVSKFKPVGHTVNEPQISLTNMEKNYAPGNDSSEVNQLTESLGIGVASSSNDTLLDVDIKHTMEETQTDSKASVPDPVIVCVSSLSNATVSGIPNKTFKYVIRNLGKTGARTIQNLSKITSAALNKNVNVFKCNNCRKVFKSKLWWSNHQESCTPGKFLCLICGKSFGIEKKLTRHVETHGLNPATCSICNETFRNDLMLKTHMMLHTGEHPHKCSICGDGFMFPKSLKKHLHTAHKVVEKDFKCNQCPKRFAFERHLTHHQDREHSGTKSCHLCSICGKTYENSHSLKTHMASHGPRNHACKLCGYKAYSTTLLNQHIMRHKQERSHTCEKCGASFYRITELKRHIFNHHTDELPQQCTLCKKAFKFPHGLKQHKILVHRIIPEGKKVFSCEICKQPFVDESKFKDHMNIHTGARPYACDECGRAFRNVKTFTMHKKIHSKIKDPKNAFPCGTCNKTFKTHRTLHWHQQNVHVLGTPFATMVTCDLCERAFPNLWVLNRHRLGAHSVIGPLGEAQQVKPHYECKLCNVAYENSSDLLKHSEETHFQTEYEVNQAAVEESLLQPSCYNSSNSRKRTVLNRDSDRPYGCDECDKNYASRIGLYQHRRLTHRPNSKPPVKRQLECNHCFKVYSSYASLYHHRRFTHSVNIKPIPCGTCGKTFKQKNSLNAHMLTHMDDCERKMFNCNICNKDLKSKWAYQVHMQSHMGIKSYMCNICGRGFTRKRDRDVHLGNIHGNLLLQPSVVDKFSDV